MANSCESPWLGESRTNLTVPLGLAVAVAMAVCSSPILVAERQIILSRPSHFQAFCLITQPEGKVQGG